MDDSQASDSAKIDLAFLSYARVDRNRTLEFAAAFQERELPIWIDTNDIRPASEWMVEIHQAIDRSRAVVAFLSPAYCESMACREELGHAKATGKVIIPVVIAPFELPVDLAWVADLNWIDATSDLSLEGAADKVVEAAAADLAWTNTHTRLLIRAREWDQSGRRKSGLLHGTEVAIAASALARPRPANQPQPVDLQREFVEFSRSVRRRRRIGLGGVAMLMCVTIGGVGTIALSKSAESQRRQKAGAAAIAETNRLQLETEAKSLAERSRSERDPVVSALLALEAEYRTEEPVPEARSAWVRAVREASRVGAITQESTVSDDMLAGLWSPDSSLVAVAPAAGVTQIRTSEGANVGAPIADSYAYAWAPDGSKVALLTGTRRLLFVDRSGGVVDSGISDIDSFSGWSPTTDSFALTDADQQVWICDPAGVCIPLVTSEPFGAPFSSSAIWSPDGSMVAVVMGADIADVVAQGLQIFSYRGESLSPALYDEGGADWAPSSSLLATTDGSSVQLLAPDGTEVGAPIAAGVGPESQFAWHPHDDVLAVANVDGALKLVDVSHDGAETVLLESGSLVVTALAWSPTGEELAVGGADGSVARFDRSGRQVGTVVANRGFGLIEDIEWRGDAGPLVIRSPDRSYKELLLNASPDDALGVVGAASSVSWSPTGEVFAVGAEDGSIFTFDGRGRREATSFFHHEYVEPDRVLSIKWSPDGKRFAANLPNGAREVWSRPGGQASLIQQYDELRHDSDLAWSHDGRAVAFVGYLGVPSVQAADGSVWPGAPFDTSVDAEGIGEQLVWSSAGDVAVAMFMDQNQVTVTVYDSKGVPRGPGWTWTESVDKLVWNEQHQLLAAGTFDGRVALLDAEGSLVGNVIDVGVGAVRALSWSPDGELLAVGGQDGEVRFIDPAGVMRWDALTTGSGAVAQTEWAPTGDRIALVNEDGTAQFVQFSTNASTPLSVAFPEGGTAEVSWSPAGDRLVRRMLSGAVELDRAWTEADFCSYARTVLTRQQMDAAVAIPGASSRCGNGESLRPLPALPIATAMIPGEVDDVVIESLPSTSVPATTTSSPPPETSASTAPVVVELGSQAKDAFVALAHELGAIDYSKLSVTSCGAAGMVVQNDRLRFFEWDGEVWVDRSEVLGPDGEVPPVTVTSGDFTEDGELDYLVTYDPGAPARTFGAVLVQADCVWSWAVITDLSGEPVQTMQNLTADGTTLYGSDIHPSLGRKSVLLTWLSGLQEFSVQTI